MTLPKFVKLRLIFLASSRTLPSAPVFDIFSDPAKSIRKSLLVFEELSRLLNWLTESKKMRWDLEECSFMLVAQVILFFWPYVMIRASSYLSLT